MFEQLQSQILSHVQSERYRPAKPRRLAQELNVAQEEQYHAFRDALKELMHAGRVVLGAGGTVMVPGQSVSRDQFSGTYRHNRRGFGFVVPTDPSAHEDLFIPEGENGGALSGDIVRAKIVNREQRDGRVMYRGRIVEIVERSQNTFVGTLMKHRGDWMVMPDGNALTEPILTPDAAARHIKPGTKLVVELTQFPKANLPPQGVITEVLGKPGEKDVDLRSVIVQFNLPGDFPEEVKEQARESLRKFEETHEAERSRRLDLTDAVICTIDPPDAKDYDDAISLRRLESGEWQLGVHIADVSFFVPEGSPLDAEASERGNSVYFPGHVIPMLPEVLSNGVCSLQEGVPRLCKSAFITFDADGRPVGTKFANTIIKSRQRLRYIEAQAIIDATHPHRGKHAADEGRQAADAPKHLVPLQLDGEHHSGTALAYDPAAEVPHPEGARRVGDYPAEVVELLYHMNQLAKRLQKRRHAEGQIVLDLPEVNLVLDEEGKVVDAVPEDTSFTHTLIEMFMVEANEAVARLLDSMKLPFIRRTHPEPDLDDAERLRHFVQVAGFKIPRVLDRPALQKLLAQVRGKPEAFAISLAVLKSLTRAEYSPEPIGHYALASQHYCHFTSPIRRYADLTVHRLLDAYFDARGDADRAGGKKRRKVQMPLDDLPSFDDLVQLGRHISFTERRAADAEKELRQVKLLELLGQKIGEEYMGVVTGVTNFGLFIQLSQYLIEGVIRYEHLMDDWWDVDPKSGSIRGQRTGTRIRIGDVCKVIVARVDQPRRELDLSISQLLGRSGGELGAATPESQPDQHPKKGKRGKHRKGQPQNAHPVSGKRGGGPRFRNRGGGRRRR